MSQPEPLLSICIATYNRARFIGETLSSILDQLPNDVELVVVDGASPDNTEEMVRPYVERCASFRYFREPENSGVDRDYDKAVNYARGTFCWLMTDDDLLRPGAVWRVLQMLTPELDLLVVNSEVRNSDLTKTLDLNFLKLESDRSYGPEETSHFFADAANALSFIGGTVIRRSIWLSRSRAPYFGSLFIHMGVIFQAPMPGLVKVAVEPLILIRYGNAMWTARGFEIWMFKWPSLIWSFKGISAEARNKVSQAEPWKRIRSLYVQRAIGAYGFSEYRQFIAPRARGLARIIALMMALAPGKLVNAVGSLYCYLRHSRMGLFDMARSPHATWLSRLLGRTL
ncbi:MAG: glycosyltransferase family 2 protein [Pseudomonadota bacterium]